MSKQIPLTQGKVAIVDDEDYERLSKYKWFAKKDYNTFYAIRHSPTIQGKRTTIYMHRQILNAIKGQRTDHHNHCGLDNRKVNLRPCTNTENIRNQMPQKGKVSKYKGVHWSKGRMYKGKQYSKARPWRARIRHKRKRIHLGYFDNEIEAAKAYDKTAKKLFGEFACLNF